MEKGYNSDILVQGRIFHVQTEDWGRNNPFVVTTIFRNGAVIKSIKNPYENALKQGPVNVSEAIRLAMKSQHQKILDLLLSGQLDLSSIQ